MDQSPLLVALEIAVGVIALAGAIYGFLAFLDRRIRSRLEDEAFLRRVASRLRPYAIFDSNGSVLADQGAMEHISRIDVTFQPEINVPQSIILTLNRHFDLAPLLTTLETELVDITARRGPRFTWIYDLRYDMYGEEPRARRFRVELFL